MKFKLYRIIPTLCLCFTSGSIMHSLYYGYTHLVIICAIVTLLLIGLLCMEVE